MDLLLELPQAEFDAIVGRAPVNIAVEAAIRMGWDAIIGREGGFVGMSGFGASAPAKDLYAHFGITVDAVLRAAEERLR
jgi:transketolase